MCALRPSPLATHLTLHRWQPAGTCARSGWRSPTRLVLRPWKQNPVAQPVVVDQTGHKGGPVTVSLVPPECSPLKLMVICESCIVKFYREPPPLLGAKRMSTTRTPQRTEWDTARELERSSFWSPGAHAAHRSGACANQQNHWGPTTKVHPGS